MAALGMTMVIVAGGIDLSVGSIIALTHGRHRLLLRHGASARSSPRSARVAAGAVCGAGQRRCSSPGSASCRSSSRSGTMLLVRGAAKGLADERRHRGADHLAERACCARVRDGSGLLPAVGHLDRRCCSRSSSAVTLQYTRFGRHLFAIGSNERTARLCGVRVERTQGRGLHARRRRSPALAGVLQFSQLSVGDPTVAVGLELDVIAAVIIGGGSLLGRQGHRRRHDRRRRRS